VAEFFDGFKSMREMQSEIESTVRAAGGYVRASDDLRPRVLENARIERRECRAQRIVRQAALCVVVFAASTPEFHSPPGSPVDGHPWSLLAASSESLLFPAQASTLSSGDVAWQLVDSLTELRRRQANALHHSP
jgi:hypothetical protein